MSASLIAIQQITDAMQAKGAIYYVTLQGYIIFDLFSPSVTEGLLVRI